MADRYRMEEPLGRGGMGEVWRACDELLERSVAVKFARLEDAFAAERLKKEARNAGRLHHPNIVGVFDFIEDGATCWIVMEYVPAPSLARVMVERGPLAPDEAGAIGCQVADALAASHIEGVVHGDVTPENVLVRDDGVVKLTDFGISRALWSDPTVDGSRSIGVRGKPRYLPPEVANGRLADKMSDMFALGATLYAAVEGRSPYGDAENAMAYLALAVRGAVQQPRRAGRLTEPLLALLAAEPRRRPDAPRARKLLSSAAPMPASVQERLHDERGPLPPEPAASPESVASPEPAAPPESVASPEPAAPPVQGSRPAAGERRSVRAFPPSGRRRRSWAVGAASLATAAAVVALVVLGPWGADDGDAGAGGPAAPAGDAGAMGDVRGADPCALLDTKSFTGFGDPYVDTDYGEPDRCDILINKGDTDIADVQVNFASDQAEPDSQSSSERIGRITVVELPGADGECDRNLRLADGNQVWIMAKQLDSPRIDPCALARAATDHAVTVLNRGPVPRRPAPFPTGSLALLHACDLLDSAALSAFPGVGAQSQDPDFADWGCTWEDRSSRTGVHLKFDRDDDLTDDGDPKTLGGRQAYVAPEYEGPHTCVVMSVHRTYLDTAGDDTVEYVYLETYGPQPGEKLCDTAEALTTAVVRKLQKA
ncbi:hypothetical protein GCM10018793_42090 [Streptomyces sulfonofaciens]|uniref:non-specific serine/threonine protein kinase n=1 Tax=Streptomyces sulfonofaciens TaxID=68272 RepID=A0A919GDD1_9ACTN|nr:serine/threonine-protein kinase [Streptomyces sulfonofaciens]GHH82384.1 hypothetical protein GCM10018793_42090 [Streptomyces sulfonofaciens]